MPANRARVIRSPRLAAMGVATLSGLMPTFLDAMITPIMIRPGQKRRGKICQVSVEMVELTQEMVSIPNNGDQAFLVFDTSCLEDIFPLYC